MDDEALAQIQTMANGVIEQVACENPSSAKVYLSQLEYLQDYSNWRSASEPSTSAGTRTARISKKNPRLRCEISAGKMNETGPIAAPFFLRILCAKP